PRPDSKKEGPEGAPPVQDSGFGTAYAFRNRRTRPTRGRPRAARASVAGSGTDGGGPPSGGGGDRGPARPGVFESVSPSAGRLVIDVNVLSAWSPKVLMAQKFPSPSWPVGMVGPLYFQVRLSMLGSSPGFSRSGVGPAFDTLNDHPSGAVVLPA